MNKSLILLIGFLGGSLIVLMFLSSVLKSTQKKPLSQTVAPTKTQVSKRAFTTISAVAAKSEVKVGEQFQIAINIATGDNLVQVAQIELGFDPSLLAIENVAQGDFFPISLANKTDLSKGKIVFAVSSFDGKKGKGTLAFIRARGLKPTKGLAQVLRVEPTTFIGEFKNNDSVLKERIGASLVIR